MGIVLMIGGTGVKNIAIGTVYGGGAVATILLQYSILFPSTALNFEVLLGGG